VFRYPSSLGYGLRYNIVNCVFPLYGGEESDIYRVKRGNLPGQKGTYSRTAWALPFAMIRLSSHMLNLCTTEIPIHGDNTDEQ
jgi:hypothetical protein